MLWHDGGCLGHRGNFSGAPLGQRAGFDTDAWPGCAGAIRARREHYEALPWGNHTAVGGVAGYSIGGAAGRALFECDFQLEVCMHAHTPCMSTRTHACACACARPYARMPTYAYRCQMSGRVCRCFGLGAAPI